VLIFFFSKQTKSIVQNAIYVNTLPSEYIGAQQLCNNIRCYCIRIHAKSHHQLSTHTSNL